MRVTEIGILAAPIEENAFVLSLSLSPPPLSFSRGYMNYFTRVTEYFLPKIHVEEF